MVGGAVRNALLGDPDRRHRYRDHGAAGRSGPPRQGGRHQERADRHRARHRDAGGRRAAVRGDDAARGYRDLRPQGQGRVRPRLGRATRERRDFTINALSVDADGVVHDHVGGLADIAARRVRFIGDADQRIAEDYLRILRFFRIHAAYGAGEPDRAGYLACIGGRAGLADAVRRARAHGNAEAAGRARARRRGHGDGRWRAAAADLRRRHLYRTVRRDDRGRAHARACAGRRCAGSARSRWR